MSDTNLRDRANAYARELYDQFGGDPREAMIRALAIAYVTGVGLGMESEATRRLCGEPGEVLA